MLAKMQISRLYQFEILTQGILGPHCLKLLSNILVRTCFISSPWGKLRVPGWNQVRTGYVRIPVKPLYFPSFCRTDLNKGVNFRVDVKAASLGFCR